jgi:phosphopantetheinyl transferase
MFSEQYRDLPSFDIMCRVMERLAVDLEGCALIATLDADQANREAEFSTGRLLAASAVAELVGIDAEHVTIGVTDLGAPHAVGYADVCLSISHTRGLVLAGAVFGDYFGIDVEWADRDVSRLSRALSNCEREFVEGEHASVLDILVAKEAVAKSWGTGLSGGLARWPVAEYGSEWIDIRGEQGTRRAYLHRVDVACDGVIREALVATVT